MAYGTLHRNSGGLGISQVMATFANNIYYNIMNRMITTTTNAIEGWEIKEYLQPISSNVVIGANIFSDFAASFTDFFGGRSGSYERRLNEIYDQSIKNLTNKANALGANCIVGLKIDFGEVSGKGTQMFMISAVGTPVKASKKGEESSTIATTGFETFDGELIERKIKARNILALFGHEKPVITKLNESDVNFIVGSRLPELSNLVLDLLSVWSFDSDAASKQKALPTYFENLDRDAAIAGLYDYMETNDIDNDAFKRFLKIALENDLIEYGKLKPLLYSERTSAKKFALELLGRGKASYSAEDVAWMCEYSNDLMNIFKPLGTTDQVKGRFSSTPKDVWICACGTKNGQSNRYCGRCAKDIYGFSENEAKPDKVGEVIANRLAVIAGL